MTFVKVYKYKIWNSEILSFVPSLRMGTRAAVAAMHAEIIEGSEIEVPVTELDAKGFTKPGAGN